MGPQQTIHAANFPRRLILAALALCSGAPPLAGAAEAHWQAVTGAPLQTLFRDREYGDGVHFAYQFRRNGTFTGTEMGRSVEGNWRASGNEICWTWRRPRSAEECYRAQKQGVEVRLFANGIEAWNGTLGRLPSDDIERRGR